MEKKGSPSCQSLFEVLQDYTLTMFAVKIANMDFFYRDILIKNVKMVLRDA